MLTFAEGDILTNNNYWSNELQIFKKFFVKNRLDFNNRFETVFLNTQIKSNEKNKYLLKENLIKNIMNF